MRRWLAGCVVCVFMLLGTVPLAWAETSFGYLDEHGDLQLQTIPAGHVIGGDWDPNSTTLTGWYAVTGTLTVNHTLQVQGEAFLILTDGAALNVTNTTDAGIGVPLGNSLTVYAQSTGANMGRLTAAGSVFCAGIGGNIGQDCGAITINGGSITASSSNGAGIGGGGGFNMLGSNAGDGGTITINAGSVTASSSNGAGIGGGEGDYGIENSTGGSGGAGGTIVVNGGTVTATSNYSTGIGGGPGGEGLPVGDGGNGGDGGDGATVTINAGSVTARSTYGAGIGGGNGGYHGQGQTVGGSGGSGGIVTINGGTVTASSTFLASIGGGDGDYFSPSNHGGDGGTITINGGTVTGSQIGMGGSRGPSGTVEINGGTVNGRLCTGWYSAGGTVTIRGGTVDSIGIAKSLYGYAGGTVNISGGTITVGSEGIANGATGGSVIISGGSVNVAGTIGSTPTNGSANGNQEVYLTRPRLNGLSAVTAVSTLTLPNASYYGTKDLYTDADGYLYLYLPAGAAATGAETADWTYVGEVASGGSGTLTVVVKSSPQTGDDSHLPLWITLMLLSGLGLVVLLTAGRRGLNRR